MLLFVIIAGINLHAQTTIFSQDFSSSTSVSSYISATPNSGQFNDIAASGTNTVSINSGALRFTRGNNNGSFTRSTDFSITPTAIAYKFDINVSGVSANTTQAATFQVGSSYSTATSGTETNANTYAQLGIDFRGSGAFRVRDITNNNTSSNYSLSTTYSITWVMNNSGSSLTYTAPDGSSETVANDRMDVWVGTTRIYNDVTVQTTTGTLTDLKFAFTAGTGTIDIDNINIYSINPFITAQPASLTRCTGASASFSVTASGTSLSYQWKKGGVNLSNGGTISGATTSTLSISSVAAGDAATDYTVDVISSGGYTATSNNTSLTVSGQPTITTSSAAAAVCNSSSSQNSSLSYSATTNTPTTYTITWNAAAITAGLVNVGSTALPASPITVPVAANVAAGTYTGTLTVTNAGGCSSSGNSFTLTINAKPSISGTLTTCVGSTTQLTGSGTAASSSPWVSASTGVATVNSTGLVTGVSAGTSVITYTDNNGCSNTATVTVISAPTQPAMSPASASSCNGIIHSLSVSNYVNNSPQTTSSGTISVSIPDNSATGATSTIAVSGIPSGATVTGVSVNFNITHTYDGDLILNLKAPNGNILNLVNGRGGSANNFTNTVISSSSSNPVSGGSAPFTNTYSADAASGVGATSNVSNVTAFSSLYSTPNGNWVFSARDNANGDVGTITSWSVTITYTLPDITWQTNVTELYTDAAATVPYTSQITTTVYARPSSTQTYTATATASNGCTSSNTVTVTITGGPAITTSSTAANVCYSSSSQNSSLGYSATTGSPTTYTITWNAAALAAGLVNVGSTSLPASPITVPVAAGVAAGTYTGTLTVTNAGGCISTGNSFTLTIDALPTITASATASAVCYSGSSQNSSLSYSATTGSPTTYTITWNAAALAAGLVNVGSTSLPASPITIPVAASVAAATYTGTIAVTNANGCTSTGTSFTLTVNGLPTITTSATAAGRCFSSSSQNSSLSYSAVTNSPTDYTITWDAAALTAGLVNVGSTALPASPITVPVAAGVAAGTYTGTLTVTNSNGCTANPGNSFTLTISNTFPVMTSASSAAICSGSTVNIPLTSNIASTYTWIAADNTNTTGESTSIQSTSTLNNTISSSSGVVETVSYTVTPTSTGGCTGSSQTVTVTVNIAPTITASATAASRCYKATSQNSTLSYTATTGSPANYTIIWDATALAAGLTNVGSTALPASPITVPVAAGVAAGTYNGTLTVSNATCTGSGQAFTLTILSTPSITISPAADSRCSKSTSQTTTLAYSAVSGSPTLYGITWNAAAISAGLVNMNSVTFPSSSPLNINVAAGVASGTYTGTLYMANGNSCSSTGNSFTFTINSGTSPVMTSASSATLCSGNTVSIPLTSDIPSTYKWIAANNTNITGESTTQQSTGTLSNTLTNTSVSTQNVIYTVTPLSTAGNCQGDPQTVTVSVYVTPAISTAASAATRCYNSASQTTTLSYSSITGSPNQYSVTWNAAALAAGLVNISNASLVSNPMSISVAAGVAAGTYTGTLTVSNAAGCTSSGNSFTFTINAGPSITTQPVDQAACIGSSASFSVTASGTSLTYQWRKGTTNLSNGGTISGATSATLNISAVAAGDAASNYNCVVSSSSCSSVISNYVSLTTTASASAPTDQATSFVFPTVNTTSILGTYTASATGTYYLVIRKSNSTAPTNPSDGTTYTQGSSALGGTVDYVGTGISFTSNGLSPATTYYYWVYTYNTSTCGTSPRYNITNPLTGNATTASTVSCGTVTTLYWGGKGSALSGATNGTDFNTASNWSTSSSSYVASPSAPTQCNNVSIATTSTATLALSASMSVYNFTYTVSGSGINALLNVNGNTLTVNGDAVVDVLSGNTNTTISLGENSSGSGVVDFKANFRIGETYFSGSIPKSYLIGNANSKIIFRGDVLLGRTARFYLPGNSSYPPSYPLSSIGNGETPGTIEFDGSGLQQVLWNNNVFYDCFYNIVVGNQNKPYVKHVTGTYTPDNILNNLTINDGCTVDLGTSQWIREQQGGTLTLNGTAKLILGNNQSVQSSAPTGVVVPGSNFPGGFSTMNISSTSTIEYNGANSITQTVYGTPSIGSLTYGNLILSNGSGTGTASKITTSTVTVAGATTVSDKTTLTLGAGVTTAGAATINSGGRINCGTYVISGSGSFTNASGGTLGIGSTSGITASCACGNVQTTSRSFSTGGNYVYYGSSAQPTGDGLPRTMNNLTISNASGVTMYPASANYTVAGTLTLTSGALSINGDSLTINSLQRTSGTLTGSSTSSVGVTGTSVALFFTSGGRTLKNLFLNSSASADLQTALDITAGSSAGSVSVASGATLNTYGNLTLKSDANGTARIAQIPVNGAGTALGTISGNVQVERYIPAKRGWRMMTSPVSASGAPTINDAWQEGVVNTDYVYANNLNPNPGFGLHISSANGPSAGFDPTPLNNPSLLVYNNSTSAWSDVGNTLTTYVTDYPGYMLFVRGSRSTNLSQNTAAALSNTVLRVLGNINAGKQTLNVAASAGNYAIAGNPYCSTIDFRNVTSTGGVSTSSYVMWDPALTGARGVGAYQYFTQTGGAGTNYTVFPGGGSYGAAYSTNNEIQAGQAFLVPKSSSSGTLVVNENAKVSSSTSTVFRPLPGNKLARIGTLFYAVDDTSLTLLDGALNLYKTDFSDDMDVEDVRKIKNISSETFGIKKAGEFIAIEKKQSLGGSDTIVYNMRSIKLRKYQLNIDMANIDVAGVTAYLEDSYTKSKTELNLNGITVYPFSIINEPASYVTDRFRIVFKEIQTVPVIFTSISAVKQNNIINVEWKTENEKNIKSYDVEKSADGVNFTKVYTESNINNGSSSVYNWTDNNPVNGANYFRVKGIDADGKIKYTTTAKVLFTGSASSIAIFPNPVIDGKINLFFSGQKAGEYNVRLFNIAGQMVQSQKIKQPAGNSSSSVDIKHYVPHGYYMLEITKPDRTTEKINIVF